jgi:hypothetical protein
MRTGCRDLHLTGLAHFVNSKKLLTEGRAKDLPFLSLQGFGSIECEITSWQERYLLRFKREIFHK